MKLTELQTVRQEEEALEQALARLDAQPTSPSRAAGAEGPVRINDWVPRLVQPGGPLHGLPPSLVSEACKSAFPGGTQQLLNAEALAASHAELTASARRLAEARLLQVRAERGRLEGEADELEDLIALCFEKIDDDGEGKISRERFVDFVCGEGDAVQLSVHPDDLDSFFSQMSKGEEEISYEQFKEEITDGCLQVLHSSIDWRRSLRKRYRDYWF